MPLHRGFTASLQRALCCSACPYGAADPPGEYTVRGGTNLKSYETAIKARADARGEIRATIGQYEPLANDSREVGLNLDRIRP
jgi:hypothetical protein